MNQLILRDSQYIKGDAKEIKDWYSTALYCQAVDHLKNSIVNKEVELFSLSTNQLNQYFDNDLIWYEINEIRGDKSKVVNKATFYTSHYIGFYSTKIQNEIVDISSNEKLKSLEFFLKNSHLKEYQFFFWKMDLLFNKTTKYPLQIEWKNSSSKSKFKYEC